MEPLTYTYDAFLSYSHIDGAWVREQLLPRLKERSLNVIYDQRFDPGVRSAVNMKRAVEGSRFTLVILTPAWVKSPWAQFEGLLTVTEDPSGEHQRLIPLLLKPCQPPPHISELSYIDLTHLPDREAGIQRLLDKLIAGCSLPTEPPRGGPVRRGLAALSELLQEEGVRQAVVAFSIHFTGAREQIEILSSLKDLHDLLHRLQLDCYEHMAQEALRFPGDEERTENLLAYQQNFQEILDELSELTRSGTFVNDEPKMILRDLNAVREILRTALVTSDASALRDALRQIDHVLTLRLPRINMRLNNAARTLNLPGLVATLETVCRKLGELDLRHEQVTQFEEGVAALSRLSKLLTNLVSDHDQWQIVEQELRQIEGDLARSLDELESSWPRLKLQIEPLYAEIVDDWALTLKTYGEKLEKTLVNHDPVKARYHFRSYRRLAARRFFRVDYNLKQQCHELRQVGEPLAAVLRILQ
jgi:hypothetical protein